MADLPAEVVSFASPAEAELSRFLRPSARRASHHNGRASFWHAGLDAKVANGARSLHGCH
jgi:hypothetical protein